MAEARTCPECSNTLPSMHLKGLCLSCLLHSGPASARMLSPRKATTRPPGPFIARSRAELARTPQARNPDPLGKAAWAAGHARQTKLDRFVGFKVLPPAVQDPAFAGLPAKPVPWPD